MKNISALKFLLLAATALFSASFMNAQNVRASLGGTIVEEDNGQPVIQAGVQLLSHKDSTMLSGTLSDNEGKFVITAPPGDYILKISFVGCITSYTNVKMSLSRTVQDLGVIPLAADAVFLEGAVVAAKAPPVTVVEDTVVYNAAAFRVAEDATLAELLKKIPGLQINGGTVTLHGKQVQELLIGGKRFFGGDVKAGLKNISADMIENIRAYERESDMARLTGVDDGEEVPVLDLTVKKNVFGKWKNLISGGYGTSDKYLGKANASKITKKSQISVIANAGNASDDKNNTATSRNVIGNGSEGVTHENEAGVSYSKETKKYDLGASIHYDGSDRDAISDSRSESILASSKNFSNGHGEYRNLRNYFRARADLEWRLPGNTTLIFIPSMSYLRTNSFTNSLSSQFKKDPYDIEGYNPSDWLGIEFPKDPYKAIRVNSTQNQSQAISNRFVGSGVLQLSKRLSKRGRSASARFEYSFSRSEDNNVHDYLTRYYKIKANPDSTRLRKQYVRTLSPSRNFSALFVFSEPLHKSVYLQAIYTFNYKRYTTDKNFYSMENLFPEWSIERAQSSEALKSLLPDGFETTFNPLFSSEGRYDYFSHRINLNLRYISRKFNITGGVNLTPQNTILRYDDGDGVTQTIKNSVFDVSPLITIKLKKSKNTQFSFTYRGTGRPQTMYNLMPVTNGTNATSIFKGNPELKPVFQHTLNLAYSHSNIKKQNSFVSNLQYVNIMHQASNCTEYDPDSGIRTTSPANIEGNWYVVGNLSANKTFKDSRFSVSSHTRGEYRNNMSYLYNSKLKKAEVNRTNRTLVNEQAEVSFRNDWFEILLNAGGEFTIERSLLRPDMNQSPWSVTTGAATDFTLPWKMHFTADFSAIFHRGNVYSELNRNYLILNTRVTQSILRGRVLLRLDWYDMLGDNANMVRSFSAERRTISIYNGPTSYLILRFVYKFGGRKK